jgi:predicted lipoprotein with Yx(FWY)xxD motif
VCVLAAFAVAAAAALATTTQRVVRASHNMVLNATVVVDTHGRTLYALHPETSHHLLCRSNACFGLWPPLTVRSAHIKLLAGHGVEGKLALIRRGSRFQVTLRGIPLYRYAGDSASGEANGEGIESFGGIWHAVSASAHPPAPAMPPAPAPAPPSPPYAY